jgi:hypothetical protein
MQSQPSEPQYPQVTLALSDSTIEIIGLTAPDTGLPLVVPQIRATLLDSLEVPVLGQAWPCTLAAVPAHPGKYRLTPAFTLRLPQDRTITAHLVAPVDGGTWIWSLPVTVRLG